jgi:hypothetical protein
LINFASPSDFWLFSYLPHAEVNFSVCMLTCQ